MRGDRGEERGPTRPVGPGLPVLAGLPDPTDLRCSAYLVKKDNPTSRPRLVDDGINQGNSRVVTVMALIIAMLAILEQRPFPWKSVLLSDYGKGVLTPRVISAASKRSEISES